MTYVLVAAPRSAADGISTSSDGGWSSFKLFSSALIEESEPRPLGEARQPFLPCDPVLAPLVKHRASWAA